jgi:hypothetical protein
MMTAMNPTELKRELTRLEFVQAGTEEFRHLQRVAQKDNLTPQIEQCNRGGRITHTFIRISNNADASAVPPRWHSSGGMPVQNFSGKPEQRFGQPRKHSLHQWSLQQTP